MKYFSPREFDCSCGCGLGMADMSESFLTRLDEARYLAKTPFRINSAVRCAEHNTVVKGAKNSVHLRGKAVDLAVRNSREHYNIFRGLWLMGFVRYGIYENFIHVDCSLTEDQDVIWYGK